MPHPNGVRPRPAYAATARTTLKDWIVCGVISFGIVLTGVLALAALFGAVWLMLTLLRHVLDALS